MNLIYTYAHFDGAPAQSVDRSLRRGLVWLRCWWSRCRRANDSRPRPLSATAAVKYRSTFHWLVWVCISLSLVRCSAHAHTCQLHQDQVLKIWLRMHSRPSRKPSLRKCIKRKTSDFVWERVFGTDFGFAFQTSFRCGSMLQRQIFVVADQSIFGHHHSNIKILLFIGQSTSIFYQLNEL